MQTEKRIQGSSHKNLMVEKMSAMICFLRCNFPKSVFSYQQSASIAIYIHY